MLSAAGISELLGEYDEDNDLADDDAPESHSDAASDSEHDWVPPVLELLESNSAGSSAGVSTSVTSAAPVETKVKRAAPTSFERKNALLRHQLHVNTLLIRCLQRSAMCDYSELAATLLSCVPPHLSDLNVRFILMMINLSFERLIFQHIFQAATLTIASLHEVVSWFDRAILLAPTSPELSVSCSTNVSRVIECGARQLLQCWQSRQADAEQIALLGVSALRSMGIPARLVCALQPLSSKFTEQTEQARKATEVLKSQGLLKYWNVTTNQFDSAITDENESAIAEVVCTWTPCQCAKCTPKFAAAIFMFSLKILILFASILQLAGFHPTVNLCRLKIITRSPFERPRHRASRLIFLNLPTAVQNLCLLQLLLLQVLPLQSM
jgi:hypothetical protein